MRYLIVFLLCLLISAPALSNSIPLTDIDLCKNATQQIERKYNIPRNLLRAISLTESGRWVEEDKANIAWPWTVTSGGAGKYFTTKTDAINHVRQLQAEGVVNIDVGCMQINLRYHPEAFDDLNQAFDPQANANYAGDFLSRLFKETKSWSAAAGRYHSSNPDKNMYYREKVMGYWNFANLEVEPSAPESYKVQRIDTQRTALLNDNFKTRLQNQREAMDRAELMQAQIAQWRKNRGMSNYGTVNAAKNKALYRQKEKRLLTVPTVSTRGLDDKRDFAARRSAQLDRWRKTVANPQYIAKEQTSTPTTLLD